mmetsp:Transcript_107578/g.335428  ORF Transcript_107578/g.335428 Transcript_107578/m.335428 type:complete len:231 (+) Transcript_107578:319-1011(+)
MSSTSDVNALTTEKATTPARTARGVVLPNSAASATRTFGSSLASPRPSLSSSRSVHTPKEKAAANARFPVVMTGRRKMLRMAVRPAPSANILAASHEALIKGEDVIARSVYALALRCRASPRATVIRNSKQAKQPRRQRLLSLRSPSTLCRTMNIQWNARKPAMTKAPKAKDPRWYVIAVSVPSSIGNRQHRRPEVGSKYQVTAAFDRMKERSAVTISESQRKAKIQQRA